jgi:aryl-phospho-beta-D-glucosidase BglC (GH1 family)
VALLLTGALCAQTPVQQYGHLSVSGNRIVDSSGNSVSLAGMSLFWSNTGWGGEAFYNAAAVQWTRTDWGIEVIRAAMGVEAPGGYLQDPSNKAKVETVVNAAIQEGIYVIIDWHSHHAEDHKVAAITFFTDMATQFGHLPNVIYEVYNEPLAGVSWSNTVKPYAENVIDAIRAIDPDNLIIVGSPTWSQDVDVASQDPITGRANIAYTLHFYAETHTASLRQKALVALNNGIPLFVTEWGTVNAGATGSVAYQSVSEWMQFLCEHKISHCNWALNDKQEAASALVPGVDPNGGWSASQLTASGTLVKSIIEDWETTCPAGVAPVMTVRLGSPPNPNALLPGATAPRIGAVWDPAVDHSAFFPSAIMDFLVVSTTQVNAPSPFGTLLIDPSVTVFSELFTTPGTFAVPLPYDNAIVGLQLSVQAASLGFGVIELTNAIDLVVGG